MDQRNEDRWIEPEATIALAALPYHLFLVREDVRRRANCIDAQGGAIEARGHAKYLRDFLLTTFQ